MAFVKSGTGFSSRDPSKARETVCGFLSRAGSSSGGINVQTILKSAIIFALPLIQ